MIKLKYLYIISLIFALIPIVNAGLSPVEDMEIIKPDKTTDTWKVTPENIAKLKVKMTQQEVNAKIIEEAALTEVNVSLENQGDFNIKDFKVVFPFVQVPEEFEVSYAKNASKYEKISREEAKVVSEITGTGAELYASYKGYLWKFDLEPNEVKNIDIKYREKLKNQVIGKSYREYTYWYNLSTIENWRTVDYVDINILLKPSSGRTMEIVNTSISPTSITQEGEYLRLTWKMSHTTVNKDLTITYRTSPKEGVQGLIVHKYLDRTKLLFNQTNRVYLVTNVEGFDESIKQEEKSVALAVVMDNSGSMDEIVSSRSSKRKIDNAKSALISLIQSLPEYDEIAIVKFSTNAVIVSDLTTKKSELITKVDLLQPEGSTNMGAGLEKAIESLNNAKPDSKKNILFLTDGMTNTGRSQEDILNLISKNPDIAVTTFAYGEDADKKFLSKVALQGGGNYYFVDPYEPESVTKSFLSELEKIHPILAKDITLMYHFKDPVRVLAVFGAKANIADDQNVKISIDRLINGNLKTFEIELKISPLTTVTGNRYELEADPTGLYYLNMATGKYVDRQLLPISIYSAKNQNDVVDSVDFYATTQVQADLTSYFLYKSQQVMGGEVSKTKEEIDRQIQEFKDMIKRNPGLKEEYMPLIKALERIKVIEPEVKPTATPIEVVIPVAGVTPTGTATPTETMPVEATPAPTPTPSPTPSFEALFAIIGLLIVFLYLKKSK
ncbi:MAG: VWA domain-containing protein [Methanosarcinales archaeon]